MPHTTYYFLFRHLMGQIPTNPATMLPYKLPRQHRQVHLLDLFENYGLRN
jgi:hypothetical protein